MMHDSTYTPSSYAKGKFVSKAVRNSIIVLIVLFVSIYIGSERFGYVDLSLYGYLWASIVSFLAMTIRITAWTLRPPTRQLWKQGIRMMTTSKGLKFTLKTLWNNIVSQQFIAKRSPWRWVQHLLIAWGCILSFAITFALVFNWMHFELVDPRTYLVVFFGIPLFRMAVDSWVAIMLYHGLNWTAFMVIAGCVMAIVRRIREKKVLIEQAKEFDYFPLVLLIAVSVTGSLLTVSTLFMEGVFYQAIGLIHQITVIVFLLYFPFSKFWHVPMRFLAVVVPAYHSLEEAKQCARCGREYATQTQIKDVQFALKNRNLSVPMDNSTLHFSDLCSECRRVTHRLAAYGAKVEMGQAHETFQTNGRNGVTQVPKGEPIHAAPTKH